MQDALQPFSDPSVVQLSLFYRSSDDCSKWPIPVKVGISADSTWKDAFDVLRVPAGSNNSEELSACAVFGLLEHLYTGLLPAVVC